MAGSGTCRVGVQVEVRVKEKGGPGVTPGLWNTP